MSSYKSLKFIKFWFGLGLCWIFLVIHFSTTSNPPDTSVIEFGDKIFHALAYFCLFFWFGQIYQTNQMWKPAIVLIILGVGLEFIQYSLGYRTLEIADMLANTTGVLIGWLLSYFMFSKLFEVFEKSVFSKG